MRPDSCEGCHILRPTSFQLRVELRDSPKSSAASHEEPAPRYMLHAIFPDVKIVVSRQQLQDMDALKLRANMSAQTMRRHANRLRFGKLGLRPQQRPSAGQPSAARAWWRYTIACVRAALQRPQCSWHSLVTRAVERQRYVALFLKGAGGGDDSDVSVAVV